MPVPSQGHCGFHSFPVVDWFCLFIYLWVLTFPLLDCSEFGNFVITLIEEWITRIVILVVALVFLTLLDYHFKAMCRNAGCWYCRMFPLIDHHYKSYFPHCEEWQYFLAIVNSYHCYFYNQRTPFQNGYTPQWRNTIYFSIPIGYYTHPTHIVK
jgi:fumarate reductase subunit D